MNLLFAHLILVTFQFVLRSTILDTTFYRDVILIGILIWSFALFMLTIDTRVVAFRVCSLDVAVLAYVAYGVLASTVAAAKGIGLMQTVLQFRNQFLPVALYFASRYALRSFEEQSQFVRLAFALTIVLCFDVIGEQLLSLFSVAGDWVPWYPYFFRNSDRFVGNAVAGTGYVDPAESPVLGVLGWPHYTAATLVALFALVYPFLSVRLRVGSGPRRKAVGLSVASHRWLRRGVVALPFLCVVILSVRTHLISLAIILLVIPLMLDRTVLKRNVVLLLLAVCASIWVAPVRMRLISAYHSGFVGDVDRPPVAKLIFTSAEVNYFRELPIDQKLFGLGNVQSAEFAAIGNFEVKILFFTVAYGILWFAIFAAVYVIGLWYAVQLVRHSRAQFVRTFAVGAVGLLIVYLIDMVHYARLMYFPNLDFWAVTLGCLANLRLPNQARAERCMDKLHWRLALASSMGRKFT